MGAFDGIPNVTVPDPDQAEEAAAFRKKWGWEPHEMVIMKGAYTGAEQEQVENAGAKPASDKKRRGETDMALGTARNKLLEVMIVDWTFAQEGRKVSVSPATIRRLPMNYRKPLLEKCDELAEGMTEDEQEELFPSSNGHIAASSDEMSPSLTSL